MNYTNFDFKKNFILIILSFFFSLLFFNDQVAVRGGLIISEEIKFAGEISPLKFYFLNSWTLLTQTTAFLLKFGFSPKFISFILVFILNIILFYSCFLILNKFTNNFILSLIISLFLIFFQKNLGDTDYPSLIYTIHTFGAYSQALVGLIVTLLICNYLRLSIFFSFLLFVIHPIVGLWVLTILFTLIFFLKEIPSYKKLIIYVTPGLILTALSLSFFLFSSLDTYSYDRNLFNIYMDKWDGHRAKTSDIHFEYIFKTIIVLLVINFFLENKKKYKFIIYFLNSLIISSILIYFIFKFSNLNSVGVFSSIIPGRFMATYTFISWPLVLSLIYEKFKKYNYINNLFYLLIIIYSIMHNKNFIQVKNNLSNLEILSVNKNQNKIFHELRDFEDTKNIIATENATFNTLYISKKPVLLSRSFDFLPYHRYLVNDIKEILEEVYGYNFNNPPIKNYPYLNDKYIKDNFEKRSKKDWIKIKNKFKSNYVITPNNWKLNLELISKDKNFKIYKII
tara:strand:+ start:5464 stop:6990 length:1527 start_codon:yes stop_codon:yes gene_type:complete